MQKVTDEQILKMLQEGKSYSDIQAELRVSPSRIIVVKKMHLKATSSTNDALLGTPTIEKKAKPPTPPPLIPPTPTPPPQIKQDYLMGTDPEAAAVKKEEARLRLTEIRKSQSLKSTNPAPTPTPTPPIPEADHEFLNGLRGVVNDFELDIIQRYLALDGKNVKVIDLMAFIKELQLYIKNRTIDKQSKYAKEIMHIQKELIKIWEENQDEIRTVFKLNYRDNFVRNAYKKARD